MRVLYLFDCSIVLRRLDGKPCGPDELIRAKKFAKKVNKDNTGHGDLSIVELTKDEPSELYIQGVRESSASNPALLDQTSLLLRELEKQFPRIEAEYDVTIEWSEVDEEYERVEDMKDYEPCLTITTNMKFGEVKR
jgi:hypothetical protein